jgi:hypothetical protein
MARPPKKISAKAVVAWEAGDEAAAVKLSGLQSRQLRNRLGPPGRGAANASQTSAATTPAPAPPKLVQVAPRAKAAHSPPIPLPPPSEPEPTDAEIARVDTREEAEAIYADLRRRMLVADEVRYASLAQKALDALNRIEQIDKRRPQPPTQDEVTRRIVDVRDKAIERIGILTSDAAAKLARDREAFAAWCAQTLAPAHAAEVVGRVNAMLGGA